MRSPPPAPTVETMEPNESSPDSDDPTPVSYWGQDWADGDRWWILIERDHYDGVTNDLWIGPYPGEDVAELALEHALLIEDLCQENCLDATMVYDTPPATDEIALIDPNDADHTGAYTTP